MAVKLQYHRAGSSCGCGCGGSCNGLAISHGAGQLAGLFGDDFGDGMILDGGSDGFAPGGDYGGPGSGIPIFDNGTPPVPVYNPPPPPPPPPPLPQIIAPLNPPPSFIADPPNLLPLPPLFNPGEVGGPTIVDVPPPDNFDPGALGFDAPPAPMGDGSPTIVPTAPPVAIIGPVGIMPSIHPDLIGTAPPISIAPSPAPTPYMPPTLAPPAPGTWDPPQQGGGGPGFMTIDGGGGPYTEGYQPPTPITLAPPPAAQRYGGALVYISGRLVDQYGNGINNTAVSATDQYNNVYSYVTGPTGSFSINAPAGGSYVITASSPFFDFTPKLVFVMDTVDGLQIVGNYNYGTGDAPPQPFTDPHFLGPPVQAPGANDVVQPIGVPVQISPGTMPVADYNPSPGNVSTTGMPDYNATIAPPADLVAPVTGFGPGGGGPTFMTVDGVPYSTPTEDYNPTPITYVPPHAEISPSTATLSGQVTDSTGYPTVGATVRCTSSKGDVYLVGTIAGGSFSMTIPVGSYVVETLPPSSYASGLTFTPRMINLMDDTQITIRATGPDVGAKKPVQFYGPPVQAPGDVSNLQPIIEGPFAGSGGDPAGGPPQSVIMPIGTPSILINPPVALGAPPIDVTVTPPIYEPLPLPPIFNTGPVDTLPSAILPVPVLANINPPSGPDGVMTPAATSTTTTTNGGAIVTTTGGTTPTDGNNSVPVGDATPVTNTQTPATTTAAAADTTTLFGYSIPTNYLIYGGVALGVLGLVIAGGSTTKDGKK